MGLYDFTIYDVIERNARFKEPQYVEFVTDFPLLGDGSPDRVKVKELHDQGWVGVTTDYTKSGFFSMIDHCEKDELTYIFAAAFRHPSAIFHIRLTAPGI